MDVIHDGSCKMVSLVRFVSSRIFVEAMYGRFGTKGGGELDLVVEHQFLSLMTLLDYVSYMVINS